MRKIDIKVFGYLKHEEIFFCMNMKMMNWI